MHDTASMQNVMTGMFWGGVIMALPPVGMCIGLAVYLYRRRRAEREAAAEEAAGGGD